MQITVTHEARNYYYDVRTINNKAFDQPQDAILITSLRKLDGFIHELSLFAFDEDKAIGHILFFPIYIETKKQKYLTLSIVHPILYITIFFFLGVIFYSVLINSDGF